MTFIKNPKIIRGISLFLILLSTMFSWFGGGRGVQEIKGNIIFYNPITILLFFIIVISFSTKSIFKSQILSTLGFTGLLIIELWYFLTWYILTITGEFSLELSFSWAYPEFYISLFVTFVILCYNVYVLIKQIIKFAK